MKCKVCGGRIELTYITRDAYEIVRTYACVMCGKDKYFDVERIPGPTRNDNKEEHRAAISPRRISKKSLI